MTEQALCPYCDEVSNEFFRAYVPPHNRQHESFAEEFQAKLKTGFSGMHPVIIEPKVGRQAHFTSLHPSLLNSSPSSRFLAYTVRVTDCSFSGVIAFHTKLSKSKHLAYPSKFSSLVNTTNLFQSISSNINSTKPTTKPEI